VAGAPVGYELAEGAGARVVGPPPEVGVAAPVGVDRRLVADGEGSPERLAVADGEVFGVPVLKCVDVDVGDGENIAGTGDAGELVHAETVAETRTIKVAQLTTVSLALRAVPGAVMRTFIKPPYTPGGRGEATI
jgi:hypothetical protein